MSRISGRFVITLLACLLVNSPSWSQAADGADGPATLDDLLEQVLGERAAVAADDAEREQAFVDQRDQQRLRVNEMRAKLARAQAHGDALKQRFVQQQQALEAAQVEIKIAAGDVENLPVVAREVARDLESRLQASLISAQYPGRAAQAATVAGQERFISITELGDLWHLLLQEIVESGKTAHFTRPVVDGSGYEVVHEVTRVGPFTAVSNGEYLRYLPDSARLATPTRQPESHLLDLAAALGDGDGELHAVPIDPTRGALLALLAERPSLLERINQAGAVGYVIILFGILAFGVVIERAVDLHRTLSAVQRQQTNALARVDNPLGRLMTTARLSKLVDAETLTLRLDEIIVAELPALRRRLPMLAVLATAAPLLGLLGTVVGMIETFQSMTLFGAGDPKIVSGGISLALVATELGLVIAIPILLAHAWLNSVANRIVHLLEHESAKLIARREEHGHADAAATA